MTKIEIEYYKSLGFVSCDDDTLMFDTNNYGVMIVINDKCNVWIEYQSEHEDLPFNVAQQSIGIGKYTNVQLVELIKILSNPIKNK